MARSDTVDHSKACHSPVSRFILALNWMHRMANTTAQLEGCKYLNVGSSVVCFVDHKWSDGREAAPPRPTHRTVQPTNAATKATATKNHNAVVAALDPVLLPTAIQNTQNDRLVPTPNPKPTQKFGRLKPNPKSNPNPNPTVGPKVRREAPSRARLFAWVSFSRSCKIPQNLKKS